MHRTSTTLVMLLAVSLGAACRAQYPEPTTAQRVTVPCTHPLTAASYFPPETFDLLSPEHDEQIRLIAGERLAVVEEPPLWCGVDDREVYRLVFNQSVRPVAIIRVRHAESEWSVEAVQFGDPRRDDPRMITRRVSKGIPPEQGLHLRDTLAQRNYWARRPWKSEGEVNDGGNWVIEVRVDGGYRAFGGEDIYTPLMQQLSAPFYEAAGLTKPWDM